ncbi:MAG: HAMP domain-containing sensor histidine kinase [Ignavibacteriae bacterium]|nr:HAMP domain-containing sensor histidine kinase [Ignavibacteriota bacterium]
MKILIYFILLTEFAIAQVNTDSLVRVTSGMKQDSARVNNMLLIADLMMNSPAQALQFAEDALKISREINFNEGILNGLHKAGIISKILSDYPKSYNYLYEELAMRESSEPNDKISLGNCFTALGETKRATRDDEIKYDKGRNEAFNRLAAVNFEAAVNNSDNNNNSIKDSSALIKCINYAEQSLELSGKLNDKKLMESSLEILGAAYTNFRKFNTAREYLFKALESVKSDSMDYEISLIYVVIASSYFWDNKLDAAITYGIEAYKSAVKFGIKVYKLEAVRIIKEIYIRRGDYKESYNYLLQEYVLRQEMFNEDKASQISLIQTKYENEKLEHIYAEKRVDLFRLILLLSLVLLIISFTAMAYFYKHRSQKKVNAELSDLNRIVTEQKNKLTELNFSKDRFFSIVAHDLRNPFNSLLGFSEVLHEEFGTLSEEEKIEYIGYMRKASQNVYKLIDNLLQWSRLQLGKIELEPARFDLFDVAVHTSTLFKMNAQKKKIEIINEIPANSFVFADRNMINTVFRNFISNAIKFTNAGGKIILSCDKRENEIIVSVKDTGTGINPKDIEKLFRIDIHYSNKGTEDEEGTGLGLVICKEMIDKHGGRIWAESPESGGSCFNFSIPYNKQ